MKFEVYGKVKDTMSVDLCKKTVEVIKSTIGDDHSVELISLDKPSGYERGLSKGVLYVPSIAVIDDLDMEHNDVGFLENVLQNKSGIGQNLWFKNVKDFAEDMVEEWNKRNSELAGSVVKE